MQPYIENFTGFDFGKISEDQFNSIFEGAKLAADKKAEDERLAEVARLEKEAADLAERERVRVENEKLKAEAEAKEKALAAERKAAADKLAAIEKANKEARDKAAAELKKQQDIAAKAAAELKAKADAEKKAAVDKLAAEKLAAKAPVKDKIKIAINGLNLVLPESEISADIMAKFNGFKNWALSQIELM
jgi:membrane protein involved in colicin uptake